MIGKILKLVFSWKGAAATGAAYLWGKSGDENDPNRELKDSTAGTIGNVVGWTAEKAMGVAETLSSGAKNIAEDAVGGDTKKSITGLLDSAPGAAQSAGEAVGEVGATAKSSWGNMFSGIVEKIGLPKSWGGPIAAGVAAVGGLALGKTGMLGSFIQNLSTTAMNIPANFIAATVSTLGSFMGPFLAVGALAVGGAVLFSPKTREKVMNLIGFGGNEPTQEQQTTVTAPAPEIAATTQPQQPATNAQTSMPRVDGVSLEGVTVATASNKSATQTSADVLPQGITGGEDVLAPTPLSKADAVVKTSRNPKSAAQHGMNA